MAFPAIGIEPPDSLGIDMPRQFGAAVAPIGRIDGGVPAEPPKVHAGIGRLMTLLLHDTKPGDAVGDGPTNVRLTQNDREAEAWRVRAGDRSEPDRRARRLADVGRGMAAVPTPLHPRVTVVIEP